MWGKRKLKKKLLKNYLCNYHPTLKKMICLRSRPRLLATLPTGQRLEFFLSFFPSFLCMSDFIFSPQNYLLGKTQLPYSNCCHVNFLHWNIRHKNCILHHYTNHCFSEEKWGQLFSAMMNESPADELGNSKVCLNHQALVGDMALSAFAWCRYFCTTIKYSQVDSSVERSGGSVCFSVQMANGHLRGI